MRRRLGSAMTSTIGAMQRLNCLCNGERSSQKSGHCISAALELSNFARHAERWVTLNVNVLQMTHPPNLPPREPHSNKCGLARSGHGVRRAHSPTHVYHPSVRGGIELQGGAGYLSVPFGMYAWSATGTIGNPTANRQSVDQQSPQLVEAQRARVGHSSNMSTKYDAYTRTQESNLHSNCPVDSNLTHSLSTIPPPLSKTLSSTLSESIIQKPPSTPIIAKYNQVTQSPPLAAQYYLTLPVTLPNVVTFCKTSSFPSLSYGTPKLNLYLPSPTSLTGQLTTGQPCPLPNLPQSQSLDFQVQIPNPVPMCVTSSPTGSHMIPKDQSSNRQSMPSISESDSNDDEMFQDLLPPFDLEAHLLEDESAPALQPHLAIGTQSYQYTQDLLWLASRQLPTDRGYLTPPARKIITPFQVTNWEIALQEHPDRLFATYIISGIKEGLG